MSQSFPRSSRILSGRQYQRVFRNNKRLSDRYWTVLAHRHDKPEARLGLAIAKKRAKRAVDRNRLKRVARESFRYHRASLEGFDVVVMNRDSAVTASSAQLHAALAHQWAKLVKQATHSR